MRNLAKDIWVFDGDVVPFFHLPFSTRMTVIRLANGDLWIHSPIKLTEALKVEIQQLGKIKYLIAPNHLHHLFLADWQSIYPQAICYGTNEVIKKRGDLTFHSSLNKEQHWPWFEEIDQVMFSGSPLMQECIFFHRSSGALIVTDLVENFSGKNFSYWQRFVAKIVGILAPNGKMPLDWRLSFVFGKSQARKNISMILDWELKVIIMAHGVIVEQDAKAFLKRSFSWLL